MKNKNIYYIKKCWPYFKKVKIKIILFIIIGLIISVSFTFIPALGGYALDNIINNKLNTALIIIILMTCISIITYSLNSIIANLYADIQNKICLDIKKDVINSFLEIKTKYIDNESSGTFISRITKDPDTIFSAFSSISDALTDLLSNLFVIFYIMYLNIILGVITLLGTILIYIIERKGLIVYTNNNKELAKTEEKNIGIVNETIKGIRDIKLLDITPYIKNRTTSSINDVNIITKKTLTDDEKYMLTRNIIIDIFTAIILLLAVYFYKFNYMTISIVTILFMYKSKLFTSIVKIAWCEKKAKEFSLAASRIFEIIDGKKYSKETYGMLRIEELEGKIEFKNVSFSYKKEQVIKNMNFTIMPKDTLAIVGKSGSGKSTIVNLIAKMFEINNGKILIDGYNINDLDKYTIRKNIAVISQNPYIFNTTIKENLVMVNPEANKKQIENACKICEIHDFIMSLPKKYNTLVGEGGINLSGGERQRLAIARALLKKSKIILFDEATSALDNETQALVQSAINNISEEYTTIIVAHRLSTIKKCNKIMIVDGGKIVDVGNHEELMKRCQIYKTLYENELKAQ